MKFSHASSLLAFALVAQTLASPIPGTPIYRTGKAGQMESSNPRIKDAFPNQSGTSGRVGDNDVIPAQEGQNCGTSCFSSQKAAEQISDVGNTGDFSATNDKGNHWSIQSNKDMTGQDYKNGINNLPWEKVPKASRRAMEQSLPVFYVERGAVIAY